MQRELRGGDVKVIRGKPPSESLKNDDSPRRRALQYGKRRLMTVIYKGAWENDSWGTLALSLRFGSFLLLHSTPSAPECLHFTRKIFF